MDRNRAGMAQSTLKLILLSNLEIVEDEKLITKGPTNRQASKSRQVLLRDFSMFC